MLCELHLKEVVFKDIYCTYNPSLKPMAEEEFIIIM